MLHLELNILIQIILNCSLNELHKDKYVFIWLNSIKNLKINVTLKN